MKNIIKIFSLFVLYSANICIAGNPAGQADSVDYLNNILEGEHSFHESRGIAAGQRLAAQSESVDLQHTIIEARMFPENGTIQGKTGLCIEYLTPDSSLLELNLGGRGIEVYSVITNTGDSLQFDFSLSEKILTLRLPSAVHSMTDTLWISYGGELFMPMSADSLTENTPENMIILNQVVSEDYGYGIGAYWYPSLSLPFSGRNMQSFDIRLTVPQEFTAIAVGDSIGVQANPDSTITYSYSTADYGRAANSASFAYGRYARYHRSFPQCEVNIFSTSGNLVRIDKIFYFTSVILEYYHNLYGGTPYPWKTLNIVETGRDYFPLAIADHSWSIFPKSIFLNEQDNLTGDEISLLAHETAHQWWGLLVCSDPNESQWLGEGFAEFSAFQMVDELRENDYSSPWASRPTIYNPLLFSELSMASPDADYSTVYIKGAWVVRMLEHALGEDLFRQTAASFLQDHSGEFVSLTEFSSYWSNPAPEINLDTFFSQWLFGTGFPVFQVRSRTKQTDQGLSLELRVDQQFKIFDIPLDIAVYYPDTNVIMHQERVFQQTHTFQYPVQVAPDSVRIDPDYYVFALINHLPNISLSTHHNTMIIDEPYKIEVSIDSMYPVSTASLFWSSDGNQYQSISINPEDADSVSVFIPAQHGSARINYYLEVEDDSGQKITCPVGAPDTSLVFFVTSPAERPTEVAWLSLTYNNHTGIEENIVMYDLESGKPLHTYSGLGGKLALSPNNRYLASVSTYRHEVVIIDLETQGVAKRSAIPEDLGVSRIAVTDDGNIVFMATIYLELFRAVVDECRTDKIMDMPYPYGLILNPFIQKLFLCAQPSFFGTDLLVYDIVSQSLEDTVGISPYVGIINFTKDYSSFWELGINPYNAEYFLNKRNLASLALLGSWSMYDEELADRNNSRANPVFIPDENGLAYLEPSSDPNKIHLIKFNPEGNHSTVSLLSSSIPSMTTVTMCATPSGKYLVVPYVYPRKITSGNFIMSVIDIEKSEIALNVFLEESLQEVMCAVVENPQPSPVTPGDLNEDEKIDIFDLLELLTVLSVPASSYSPGADVNTDGKVDIFDLLKLLEILSQ